MAWTRWASPIVRVRGGSFWGAAKVPSNAAGGTLDVKAVHGLNPVGNNRLTGGNPGVPGSGSVLTNTTSVDCTVVIATGAGVTVSAISLGATSTGLTMGASSSLVLRVPAGQSITMTYSGGTPTWTWFGD